MCGIFGIVKMNRYKNPDKLILWEKIESALATMKHRGPDGQGTWISKENLAALGHVRLSIIDLNTGKQPLTSNDNNQHLVVNGEFYGYLSIKENFSQESYPFKTQSDSEILFPLYQKYGTNALKYLRGEFAFILWDENAQTLFAARDRFGIKPLYYAIHDGYLYLASEIKALFISGIPAKWNIQAYISRSFYFGNDTLYEGIYQVPPGHFMLVMNGNIRFHKYWDLNYPENGLNHSELLNEQSAVEYVNDLFEESIKLRLQADVEVGVYLSGGIDSSAVFHAASRLSGKNLNVFTLAFEDHEDYNEYKYAEAVVKHVGGRFNPIKVVQLDIVDNFAQALWHNETPFFNGHGIAKYLLSKAVHNSNIKVVLTGEGADEIFSGYPHYQRDLLLYGSHASDENLLKIRETILKHESALNLNDIENFPLFKNLLGYIPSWMQYQNQWMKNLHQMFNDEIGNMFLANHPYHSFLLQQDIENYILNRHPVHISMYLWIKSFLPNFVLKTLSDKMEMAHSVEGRVAFLDHYLVEMTTKIPVSLKVNATTTKYILRKVLEPHLPEKIAYRKKHYFRAPQALSDTNGKLFEFIKDHIHSKNFENLCFFDAKKVRKFLDNLPTMTEFERMNYDGVLMELTSMAILQDKFSIST